jgi:hypothetical protein
MWCDGKTLVFSGMPSSGPIPKFAQPPQAGEERIVMLTRRAKIGMAVAGAAFIAALTTACTQASADDARLTVTPAVYQTGDSSQSAQIQLVRHGWGGGYRGWGGGYRGYGGWGGYRGYGYGGFYRPYYRPFIGIGIGPRYGYGFGYGGYGPGYGYGYGYGGYPVYGYGIW